MFFVQETAEDYGKITLPYLMSDQFSFQWIFNILDHEKEVDRIIFEDGDPVNGFILLPGCQLFLTFIDGVRILTSPV